MSSSPSWKWWFETRLEATSFVLVGHKKNGDKYNLVIGLKTDNGMREVRFQGTRAENYKHASIYLDGVIDGIHIQEARYDRYEDAEMAQPETPSGQAS